MRNKCVWAGLWTVVLVLIDLWPNAAAAETSTKEPSIVRLASGSDLKKHWRVVEGKPPTFKGGRAIFSEYCRLVTLKNDWIAFDLAFSANGRGGSVTVFWGAGEDGLAAAGSLVADDREFKFTNRLKDGVSSVIDAWTKGQPTYKFATTVRPDNVTITLPLRGYKPFAVEGADVPAGCIGVECAGGSVATLEIRAQRVPALKVKVEANDPKAPKQGEEKAPGKTEPKATEPDRAAKPPPATVAEAQAAIAADLKGFGHQRDAFEQARIAYKRAYEQHGQLVSDYAMWIDLVAVEEMTKRDKFAMRMSDSEKQELEDLRKQFTSKNAQKRAKDATSLLEKAGADLAGQHEAFHVASERLLAVEAEVAKRFPGMVWDETVPEKEARLAALDAARQEAQSLVGRVDGQGRRVVAAAVVGIIPLCYSPDTVWTTRGRYYHREGCTVLGALASAEKWPFELDQVREANARFERYRPCPRCQAPSCK